MTERDGRTIQTIADTLLLLQYLVFRPELPMNLRQKLHHAPHRRFNGIAHMFVLTLGRLSFADPPERLHSEGRETLEQLAGECIDAVFPRLACASVLTDRVWGRLFGRRARRAACWQMSREM